MIKSLNKNDTLNTPYTTTRDWHFANNLNNDLILFEQTASGGGELEVAIEFIDYGDGTTDAFINSSCSLASENQLINRLTYREGRKIEGLFYPDTDPKNLDGTYKRVVYQQVQNMFYNNYRDPTKMWGMEEIDFDKSQVKKFLTDQFVMFSAAPIYMGEKVVPNSVLFIDHAGNNEYSITDDGKTNLFIGTNVFSREQELGSFGNVFVTGSDSTCNSYFDFSPITILQGPEDITVTFDDGPILITSPSNQFSYVGNTASFTVSASNPLGYPLDYYWLSGSTFLVDDGRITGSHTATLTILNVTGSDTGSYRALISNVVGYVYSNTASLSVFIGILLNSNNVPYSLGPYETFQSYDPNTSPANDGYGWSGGWDLRGIGVPDYAAIIAVDDFESYTSGSSIIGLNSGSGWMGSWNGN